MIQFGSAPAFFGSSPERLAAFHPAYLLADALAGSSPRGLSASEDLLLEKELLASRKNLEEHRLVVRDIRERLTPFTSQLEIDRLPRVRKLPNVQHLATSITARLKPDMDRMHIVGQLHPTPAVGGHPRTTALPCIKELEDFERGWYAAPFGWINLNGGGGEFTVAIRSGLIDGNRAELYAGCGIVADSEPQDELQETNLKLIPLISAFYNAGYRLK